MKGSRRGIRRREAGGNGEAAYFTYDALGRQTAAKYADVEPVYFEYDDAGNRIQEFRDKESSIYLYDLSVNDDD